MSLHIASFENALFVSFSHPHTAAALRTLSRSIGSGQVHVLGVVPPAPRLQQLFTPRETTDHVEATLRSALRADLEHWVKQATSGQDLARFTVEVATGHVVAAVLERIAEHDHDLLAVTGHPDDPAARAVISRLQRKSPVPVWVLRPDRSRRRRILAAIDIDHDHHGLDHRILAAARWLARPGDEIHVLSAWELMGEATMRSSPFLSHSDEEIDRLRSDCESRVRHELEALLSDHDLGDVVVHVHVANEPAAEAIVHEVARSSINQIVIGTIARHGIPGFVVGNTAEQLLTEVGCSEFVVKPPLPI